MLILHFTSSLWLERKKSTIPLIGYNLQKRFAFNFFSPSASRCLKLRYQRQLCVMVHTFHPSTWEAEFKVNIIGSRSDRTTVSPWTYILNVKHLPQCLTCGRYLNMISPFLTSFSQQHRFLCLSGSVFSFVKVSTEISL